MWANYLKRLPLIEALFIGICAILRFHFGRPWVLVGSIFLFLQLSGIMGAWWGYRLERKRQTL